MKNQYFGDINDYRKYGLIRCVQAATDFRTLVAWMLTPDDGSSDGKYIAYLNEPQKWSHFDPELYNHIHTCLRQNKERNVKLIENSLTLPRCHFYSSQTPDPAEKRSTWFKQLLHSSEQSDFVFLDPDNGLEVKSRPFGKKHSSKFLFWHEVEDLWQSGKSLLIYQHFIRQKRSVFVQRMLHTLQTHTPKSTVEAFSTSRVLFLMCLQPKHHIYHSKIVDVVQMRWQGEIQHWDLYRQNILN